MILYLPFPEGKLRCGNEIYVPGSQGAPNNSSFPYDPYKLPGGITVRGGVTIGVHDAVVEEVTLKVKRQEG